MAVTFTRKKATIITFGDSIIAFAAHRGDTVTINYSDPTFDAFAQGVMNVNFHDAPLAMTTSGLASKPTAGGGQMQGRKGVGGRFKGTAQDMGAMVDAFEDAGVPRSLIDFQEYACGGTMAYEDVGSPGTYGSNLPTHQDVIGGTYGCPGEVPGGTQGQAGSFAVPGGFYYTTPLSGRSMWMGKQGRLEGTGDPKEHWTFCDAIQHCETEDLILVGNLGGNDIILNLQGGGTYGVVSGRAMKFIHETSKVWDPDNRLTAIYLQIYTAMQRFCEAVHMLNPRAEIHFTGYPNFCADGGPVQFSDGRYVQNFDYRNPTGDVDALKPMPPRPAPASQLMDVRSPRGGYFPAYSGDGPKNLAADPVGQQTLAQLVNNYVHWPGGPTGLSLPMTWDNWDSPGFNRAYWGWGLSGQRDANYNFLQQWVGHVYANQIAAQGIGWDVVPPQVNVDPLQARGRGVYTNTVPYTLAPNPPYWTSSIPANPYPGYFTDEVVGQAYFFYPASFGTFYQYQTFYTQPGFFDQSYNYQNSFQFWSSNGMNGQGRWWSNVYQVAAGNASTGNLNTAVIFSGGAFINFHQIMTILCKDVTTQNLARLFRDPLRAILGSMENQYPYVHHDDVWDDVLPEHQSAAHSQDDPVGVPTYHALDFIEGLHMSGRGAPKWLARVVPRILARTQAWAMTRVSIVVREPPEYKFVIGDGLQETYAIQPLSRSMAFNLQAPSTATFKVNLMDATSQFIKPLQTDLKIYRGNEKLFLGKIGPMNATFDPNSGYAEFTAMDYKGVLERRFFYEDDNSYWYNEDVSTIMWDSIQFTQSRSGGALGITQGIGFPNSSRIRSEVEFQPGANMLQSFQQLSESQALGFDWEIDPFLKLNIWVRRGATSATAKVFDFKGASTSIQYNFNTAEFANAARATGGDLVQAEELESTNTFAPQVHPRKRWEQQLSWPDVDTQEIMQDRTAYLLEQKEIVPEEFTVKLRQGHWQGQTDIWLGDSVNVNINHGSLAVNKLDARVFGMTVELDENGREDVGLVIR